MVQASNLTLVVVVENGELASDVVARIVDDEEGIALTPAHPTGRDADGRMLFLAPDADKALQLVRRYRFQAAKGASFTFTLAETARPPPPPPPPDNSSAVRIVLPDGTDAASRDKVLGAVESARVRTCPSFAPNSPHPTPRELPRALAHAFPAPLPWHLPTGFWPRTLPQMAKRIDPDILQFAFFPGDDKFRLDELASVLEKTDDWKSVDEDGKEHRYGILYNYILYSFAYIVDTQVDVLKFSADDQWVVFHTRLTSSDLLGYEPVYMLFQKNRQLGRQPWYFHDWCVGWGQVIKKTTDHVQHKGSYGPTSCPPPFSTERSSNVLPADWKEFKPERHLEKNSKHILKDNIELLRNVWKDAGEHEPADMDIELRLEKGIELARKMRSSPLSMLPQLYPPRGRLGGRGWLRQLLMPINLRGGQGADVALALDVREDPDAKSEDKYYYYASTVLTLEQAFMNARLVHSVASPWLRDGHVVVREQRVKIEIQRVKIEGNTSLPPPSATAASPVSPAPAARQVTVVVGGGGNGGGGEAMAVRELLAARGPCIPGTAFKQRFREYHGFELDLGSGRLQDVLRRCEGEGVCELEMRPMPNGPPLLFVHAKELHRSPSPPESLPALVPVAPAPAASSALSKPYKKVLCRNWNGTPGSCTFRNCTYAHGEEERRSHTMSPALLKAAKHLGQGPIVSQSTADEPPQLERNTSPPPPSSQAFMLSDFDRACGLLYECEQFERAELWHAASADCGQCKGFPFRVCSDDVQAQFGACGCLVAVSMDEDAKRAKDIVSMYQAVKNKVAMRKGDATDEQMLMTATGATSFASSGAVSEAPTAGADAFSPLGLPSPPSPPFNKPVDVTKIPQYCEVISHPMDLGAIRKKLEGGEYEDLVAFTSDLQLVWQNRYTFNRDDPTSPHSSLSPAASQPHSSPDTPMLQPSGGAAAPALGTALGTALPSRYTQEFIQGPRLGKGGFGVVYRARHKLNGFDYAVKKVRLTGSQREQERAVREATYLAKLEHKNVVRYYDVWKEELERGDDDALAEFDDSEEGEEEDGSTSAMTEEDSPIGTRRSRARGGRFSSVITVLHIQMQLCELTMRDYLRESGRETTLEGATNRSYLLQLFAGLQHIHRQSLIHRDVKPENVFITNNRETIKIGDFGLSREMTTDALTMQVSAAADLDKLGSLGSPTIERHIERTSSLSRRARRELSSGGGGSSWYRGGTTSYMSPEQRAGHSYDHTVDIYAAGVILLELCHTFATESERVRVLSRLHDKHELPTPMNGTPAGELIHKMTHELPSQRPSVDALLASPLLAAHGHICVSVRREDKYKLMPSISLTIEQVVRVSSFNVTDVASSATSCEPSAVSTALHENLVELEYFMEWPPSPPSTTATAASKTRATALETLRSELHRLSGVVRVTGAAFAQLQSWPTGTSQSLHPADALAADEATIVQLLRDTADPLPIAPGEWQGPRVGLLTFLRRW